MNKISVVFFGTPDFAVPSLEKLYNNDKVDIKLVVTQPDKKRSRNKFEPTAVKKKSIELGLKVLDIEKINTKSFWSLLDDLNPDFLVVIAFGQIIGKTIVNKYRNRIINLHGSLLPEYRGAAPIQRAVLDGKKETGVCTMLIEEGMDSGDILDFKKINILKEDTAQSIFDKLSYIGSDLMLDTLLNYEQRFKNRMMQDENRVTYAEKINKEESYLDFSKSAEELFNKVRGCYDWPIARCIYNEKEFKILESDFVNLDTDDKKEYNNKLGTIIKVDSSGLYVQTGDGIFVIKKWQEPGKKASLISDYINGHKLEIGEKLS